MSAGATPAVRAAQAARLTFRLVEYEYDPQAEAIGVQAALALGRDPATVFKTLIVALDGAELVCVLLPAAARLDLKALAQRAGRRRAELAEPQKAERATGYVVGGISPLGQRKRLRTFVDASAVALDEIVVNGGRRGLQMVLQPPELIAATAAEVVALQST
jgi:Cys-tRNA(Pro)/Cys-tRNA(Cys) deacylase